jgi:hypothetical protein
MQGWFATYSSGEFHGSLTKSECAPGRSSSQTLPATVRKQSAKSSRRRTVGGGVRKGAALTNIFDALAKCSICGSQMRIARGGTGNKTMYLCCGRSAHGTCDAGKFRKLAPVEDAVLWNVGRSIVPPPESESSSLEANLQQAEADEREVRYGRMFAVFGDAAAPMSLAMKNLNRLYEEHRAKLAEVVAIRRRLALVQIENPAQTHVDTILRLATGLDARTPKDRYMTRVPGSRRRWRLSYRPWCSTLRSRSRL